MGFLIPRLASYVIDVLGLSSPGSVFLSGLLVYPIASLFWGILSDKTLHVRNIQVLCSWLGGIAILIFAQPSFLKGDDSTASFVWALVAISLGGTIPLANVAFLQSGHPDKKYAGVRLFGTLGFLFANVLLLFTRLPESTLIFVAGILFIFSTLFLFATTKKRKVHDDSSFEIKLVPYYFKSIEFLFFCGILFLFFASFAPAEHVIGSELKKIEFPLNSVSLSWVLATFAEALFYVFVAKKESMNYQFFLGFGLLAGILRWACMLILPISTYTIFIQTLHGLQFGPAYLGLVLWLKKRAAPHNLATAQALAMIFGRSLGTGIAAFLFANMAKAGNFFNVYLFAMLAGFIGLIALWKLTPYVPKRKYFLDF
ncbi:MAG: hypothetical protein D6767_04250 [Candidatus Hydrogenedentota bacterium]|nr:MAG: hypothetical protein D6767_04250 [Candidatus Hydrogenedentota bacterium]